VNVVLRLGRIEKNTRITVDEWAEILASGWTSHASMVSSGYLMSKPANYYMGLPIIPCKYSSDFIIFKECKYCGNGSLDRNDCCISCGAPVEM
jgi:hypothetical protein